MHGITPLTTGLPAVGMVTSAGAVLAVVVHAAGIKHRPETAVAFVRGRVDVHRRPDAMNASEVVASFVSVAGMVVVWLAVVGTHLGVTHWADSVGATQ
jgi:hypothetical protein